MKAKILIIRFSSIGDIVLTTPVIRCLKKQMNEGTEIHYLTKDTYAPILTENPYLSKIHTISRSTNEVIGLLRNENYDYIIDLHKNIRSSRVKYKLKALSFSVDKINIQKWIMVNFRINTLPKKHIVDRYMESVRPLGVQNDMQGLDYFIPKEDEVDTGTLPVTHQNGFTGIVIGAKYATKRLPRGKIINICRLIRQPLILLGGKEDYTRGEEIAFASGNHVYNTCGKFNINQSASLIKQAKKIITHDTGMMHIAAAFKKTIISIWGNTIPEFGMYPYLSGGGIDGQGTIMQVNGLSCRPCSKLGHRKCPKNHFKCMEMIDEREVAGYV